MVVDIFFLEQNTVLIFYDKVDTGQVTYETYLCTVCNSAVLIYRSAYCIGKIFFEYFSGDEIFQSISFETNFNLCADEVRR